MFTFDDNKHPVPQPYPFTQETNTGCAGRSGPTVWKQTQTPFRMELSLSPPMLTPIPRFMHLLSCSALLILFLLTGQLLQAEAVLAHGVGYAQVMDENPVVLEFQYATGDPAAYAAIKVYAPEISSDAPDEASPKVEYQNGRTDASGRFSFVPDVPGKWVVVMTDGQGHRSEAVIEYSLPVTEALIEGGTEQISAAPASTSVKTKTDVPILESVRSLPNPVKALLGLSLLLNILTFYYLLKNKMENKRRDHAHQ